MKYLILLLGALPTLAASNAQDELSSRTHRISHVSTISVISGRSDVTINSYDLQLSDWRNLVRTVSCSDVTRAKKARTSLLGYRINED